MIRFKKFYNISNSMSENSPSKLASIEFLHGNKRTFTMFILKPETQ